MICCTLSWNIISSVIHLEKLSEEGESSTSAVNSTHGQSDSDFERASSVTQVFSHSELNGLIKKLNFLKKSVELLVSRPAEKNLLQLGTKITYYCKREIDLLLFSGERDFVFCNDIRGLLMEMGKSNYVPSKWCLFIDNSKQNLNVCFNTIATNPKWLLN